MAGGAISQQDIQSFYDMLKELEWNVSSDSKRLEIFQRVESAKDELDENMDELQKNYQDVKANEQSSANRALTAATTAATSLGLMEALRGRAEQEADAAADADMTAYLETFRCTYGNGKTEKGGFDLIELPGGNDNDLMQLRADYFSLAKSLKERKESLGMKPGIESEIDPDNIEEELAKIKFALYNNENVGITGGAYSSLYRAKALDSEEDQAKIDADKEKSEKRFKYGATAAGVGIVGGVLGNLIINANAVKEKSNELRSKREQIVSDLHDVMQQIVDECNANINDMKQNLLSEEAYNSGNLEDDNEEKIPYSEYVKEIEDLTPIENLSEIQRIKDISVCK